MNLDAQVTQGERSLGETSVSLTEVREGNPCYLLKLSNDVGNFEIVTEDDSVFKALSKGKPCKVDGVYNDDFNPVSFPVTLTAGPGYKLLIKRKGPNADDDKMVVKLEDRTAVRMLVSSTIGWDHKIHAIEDYNDDNPEVRLDSSGGETLFIPQSIIVTCMLKPGVKINLVDFRDSEYFFTGITAYHEDGRIIEEIWQD